MLESEPADAVPVAVYIYTYIKLGIIMYILYSICGVWIVRVNYITLYTGKYTYTI